MTGRATILWARRACHVLRVIELNIEAFFESIGKRLAWWIVAIHARVANRAHWNGGRSELSHVTAGAIFMTRKTRPRRVVSAMMTIPAGDGRVLWTAVQKLRVVLRIDKGKRKKEKEENQDVETLTHRSVLFFPFYLFLFPLLHSGIMTGRRLLLPHIRCVAVSTVAALLELLQFSFDCHCLRISRFLAITMTACAGVYGNVRSQPAQRARACDVDVTGGAFHHVLAFAAFMGELH